MRSAQAQSVTKPRTKRNVQGANLPDGQRRTPISRIPVAELEHTHGRMITEQGRRFIKFWAEGETVKNAMIKAGYGPKSQSYVYALTHLPEARAIYDEEKRKYEEASQMTRKRVIDGFLEAIDMAKMVSEPSAAISGWMNIAKMCGYMEPLRHKVDINISGSLQYQQLNKLSDADLLKLIQEGAGQQLQEIQQLEHDEGEA